MGQRAVVVGMGNSAMDVAEDLVRHGAATVTMVQRAPICVISHDFLSAELDEYFPSGRAIDACDIAFMATPLGLYKKTKIADQEKIAAANKEVRDKLRAGGVELWDGPHGEGLYILFYERAGGDAYSIRLLDS